MSAEQIVKNLAVLLVAVSAQPAEEFDLDYFKKEEDCGTLFCTVGLACTIPYFQALGLSLLPCGPLGKTRGRLEYIATINNVGVNDEVATDSLDAVFGMHSWQRLFRPGREGVWDVLLGAVAPQEQWDENPTRTDMSDKDLAIARIRKQITIYKGLCDVSET